MYELRPVKKPAELAPLAKQFIENFIKSFNQPPTPEAMRKWTKEMVLKAQEAYVKNNLEGYSIQDVIPFGEQIAMELASKKSAVDKEPAVQGNKKVTL
jgi:hypothetical protein